MLADSMVDLMDMKMAVRKVPLSVVLRAALRDGSMVASKVVSMAASMVE